MGRKRTGHLSVNKGKRVIVHFKDGTKVPDRFIEKKGHYVILEELGKIHAGLLSTLTINKGMRE